jgi:hypothetical protein
MPLPFEIGPTDSRGRSAASARTVLLVVGILACHDATAAGGAPTLVLAGGEEFFGMRLGVRVPLRAELQDASGLRVAAGPTLRLSSRQPSVVAVDTGGVIVARGVGETWLDGTVVVNAQVLRDSVAVGVTCSAEGATVVLRLEQRTVAVGRALTPSADFTVCGGQLPHADEAAWSAHDARVLTVDPSTGRATGRTPGTTDLIVQGRRSGSSASVRITVTP